MAENLAWVLSRVLGHKAKPPAGMAAITGVYLYDQYPWDAPFDQLAELRETRPQLQLQFDIAAAMDQRLRAHTDSLIPRFTVDADAVGLMTAADVANMTGVCLTKINAAIRSGGLPSRQVRPRRGRPWNGVPVEDVRRLKERFEASVDVSSLAHDTGLSRAMLLSYLEQLGIEDFHLPLWAGRRVEKTDLGPLFDELVRLAALQSRSIAFTAARSQLGISPPFAQWLLDQGALVVDAETDNRATLYVTRASVESVAANKAGWRKTFSARAASQPGDDAVIPYVEAERLAGAYGADLNTFRELIRTRTLVIKRQSRRPAGITQASFKMWVQDGTPLPRLHPSSGAAAREGHSSQRVPTYDEVPFGYTRTVDGWEVVDLGEQAILRIVAGLVEEHMPIAGIATALRDRGLKNRFGRPWTPWMVADMIKQAGLMREYTCEWPDGCNRPVAVNGPGAPSWYCDLPEHNGHAAAKTKSRRAIQEQRRKAHFAGGRRPESFSPGLSGLPTSDECSAV